MDIGVDDHSLKELRAWLSLLGKPISGNKAALAARLSEIPTAMRGECPTVENNENVVGNGADAGGEFVLAESDDNIPAASSLETNSEVNKDILELRALRNEIEILRKEREIIAKENTLLKRSTLRDDNAQASSTTPLTLLKELLGDYEGDSDVGIWISQFRNLKDAYIVTADNQLALFISKLKGKAQQWLYQMPDYASKSVEELLAELKDAFAAKTNKLKLRQKFEARKWKFNEDFSQYCNEKIFLAGAINIEEDELVEYIIDGIPDHQLRTQANILCLKTAKQLLKAFANIDLKPSGRVQISGASSNLRCFNCNSPGHLAADCRKPKREQGSCYGCGSKEHRIADCPQRKKPILMVEDNSNDYVRNFKIYVQNNLNRSFPAECLIDSGSPINFIKENLTKKHNIKIKKINDEFISYFGINKNKLNILGKIECFIKLNNKNICFEFMVVANQSMGYDAVLGRNFMKKCNIKLVLMNDLSQDKCVCNKKDSSYVKKEMIPNYDSKVMQNDEIYKENLHETVKINETIGITLPEMNKENTAEVKAARFEDNKILDEIFSIDYEIINNDCSLKVGSDEEYFCNFFEKNYVNPIRPDEPKIRCEMKLILENSKPFHYAPRRLSYFEKNELQKLLDEYLTKGYIRPSFSQYASPIVLVKKKTNDLRMCMDFRTLNGMTAKDNYPLPLIDDLLDKLVNKKFFSKLDLKNGFFHVFMHEDSVKFTSFVTPLGQYEWQRMPFGLKNAPSVFQRFINVIFADMIRQEKVMVYMDDILVATKSLDQHFQVLKEVFDRLIENRLELRIDKCEFLQTTIKYLGYSIQNSRISPDEKGIEAVQNFPIPSNAHDVQRFLGLASYFRRYIQNFSIKAKPLYDLTKKNTNFAFGKRELESFHTLKNKLAETPVLAIYDPRHETELHCDASAAGFGAILMQRKDDSKMHPVFYFSKRTTETESRYHSFELETLAIIYALKRFRIYLDRKPFKIITDCNSLTLTLGKKELNPRIARWALELQNYDFKLEHRSSTRMQHVDALSRSTNILTLETNTLEENLIICQGRDKNLCKIRDMLEKSENKLHELRNGVVYRKTNKDTILFYVPINMEENILHKYHDEMGHGGVNKTIDLIKGNYWFPHMKEKVEKHIENCLKCIVFSSKSGKEEGYLHNIQKDTNPFHIIHIDHYGPVENKGRAKKHIFVIIDSGTKFVRLYATKTTSTKEVVDSLKDYFRAYSRPRVIVSDRGSCYTSSDFQKFLLEHNVKHVLIATGSPQANGQVERVNRSLGPIISKFTEPDSGLYWDKILEKVEFVLNNTLNRSIGTHPSVMLFGVNQRGTIVDALKENCIEFLKSPKERNLRRVRCLAKDKQRKLQMYNEKYVNKRRKKPRHFSEGDYVMLRNFDSNVGTPKKLIPKFKGPYRVTKVLRNDRYVVKDVDNFQHTQIPYKGVWAIGNLRPWLNGRVG